MARGSLESWRGNVADALRRRHKDRLADRLEACGQFALVASCGACGERDAAIRIRTTCGMRVCPWCARLNARTNVAAMVEACTRAGETAAARAAAAADQVVAELARARELVAHHSGRKTARARALVAKHEARAKARAREVKALRERHTWIWKMVTLSPQWNPRDASEYTPEGLRARIKRIVAAWRACWEAGARAGGLAFATLRLECSAKGHVHAHVIYWGPHAKQSWWQKTAGMIVDVRKIRPRKGGTAKRARRDDATTFSGLVEAVKYSLKTHSPLQRDWVAGRAEKGLPHPELAAAWLLATRRLQVARHYGLADDCLRAARAAPATGGEPPPHTCAACNTPLAADAWRRVAVRAAAAAVSAIVWRHRLAVERCPWDESPAPMTLRGPPE